MIPPGSRRPAFAGFQGILFRSEAASDNPGKASSKQAGEKDTRSSSFKAGRRVAQISWGYNVYVELGKRGRDSFRMGHGGPLAGRGTRFPIPVSGEFMYVTFSRESIHYPINPHYARDAVARSRRWSCRRATIPRHRGTGPEAYLFSTSQGSLVLSLSKGHPRSPGRTAISAVGEGGLSIMRASPSLP
jgi:hypothetical protein